MVYEALFGLKLTDLILQDHTTFHFKRLIAHTFYHQRKTALDIYSDSVKFIDAI